MKKVILHIGCEKTGTTSIQRFFSSNRNHLLLRHGLLYPSSLGAVNHTKFAIYACDESRGLTRFLRGNEDLNLFRVRLREQFLDEVRQAKWDRLLISAEWLHPRIRNSGEFHRVCDLLSPVANEIEILMYIRRQDEMATSLYSTALKAGSHRQFSFPRTPSGTLPYYYDFYQIYQKWKSVFGAGSVTVKVFDSSKLLGQDVVKDLMNWLGIPESKQFYVEKRRSNESLTNEGLMLMRMINFWEKYAKEDVGVNVACLRNSVARAFAGTPDLTSPEESSAFLESFAESNEQLAREYFNDTGKIIEFP